MLVCVEHYASMYATTVLSLLFQAGTWAGNLMLTHDNDNFPSDVYTIMEAAGAAITIATSATAVKSYTLSDFLQVSMEASVIVSMEIPFLKANEILHTFKVMPRFQVHSVLLLNSLLTKYLA